MKSLIQHVQAIASGALLSLVLVPSVYAEQTAASPAAASSGAMPQKTCPDLRAQLELVTGPRGKVYVHAAMVNVGTAEYAVPSKLVVVVSPYLAPGNAAAAKTDSITLTSKKFDHLAPGASVVESITYQMPNFGSWESKAAPGEDSWVFTLSTVKQDDTALTRSDDCHLANNAAQVLVDYRKTGR